MGNGTTERRELGGCALLMSDVLSGRRACAAARARGGAECVPWTEMTRGFRGS